MTLMRFTKHTQQATRNAGTTRTGSCRLFVYSLAIAAVGLSGCSRSFWRKQADERTYEVIGENLNDQRWAVPRMDIEPDPSSRLFDPYEPDKAPLPPDDPTAHRYMHEVAGMRGYKSWHKLGQSLSVENPQWLEPFGVSADEVAQSLEEDGEMPLELPGIDRLKLDQAIELSLIHSREYQNQLENVYLTALDLTFDRFQYDVRYLGLGGRPSSRVTHTNVPTVSRSLGWNSRMGASQLLPSGGQWAVELANNTMWFFTGGGRTSSASVLSYSLVQPLLRGAGRKVVLEGLTQSERDVLYSVRDLARFRKEFFTEIVSGGGSGGFLSLLQQQQEIKNERGNIRRLEQQVVVLRTIADDTEMTIREALPLLPPGLEFPESVEGQASYDADGKVLAWKGAMTQEQADALKALSNDAAYQAAVNEITQRRLTKQTPQDVAQLETRLATSRNSLRTSERRLADSLDRYKTQLGLPPNMPMTIENRVLEAFELVDARLIALEQELRDFVDVTGPIDSDDPDLTELRAATDAFAELLERFDRNAIQLVRADFEALEQKLPARLAGMTNEVDRTRLTDDIERDRQLFLGPAGKLDATRTELADVIQDALRAENVPQVRRAALLSRIVVLREELLKETQGLQVIQANQRVELITLEPFEISEEEAVRNGLQQRLDLMNARGALMDARRDVEVTANALEAVLDVRIEGDVRSKGGSGHPFDFREDLSSFRAGLSFTAPVDQIAERNAYRRALVAYQRARRTYMSTEDNVKLSIRNGWRQMQALTDNFEITRERVRSAGIELDTAIEKATDPAAAGGRQSSQQGLNLLSGLSSVLDAQDSLIGIWVNYERSRLNIHRDMGIMEVDETGFWTDSFYQRASQGGENLDSLDSLQPVPPEPVLPEPAPAGGVQSSSVTNPNGISHVQFSRATRRVGTRSRGRVSARRPTDRGADGSVVPASATTPTIVEEVDPADGSAGSSGWRRSPTRSRVLGVRGG